MASAQSGQSRVGAGAGFGASRFTCWTTRKITNATMTKSTMELRKRP
jgi:hypothetical protein